VKNRTTTREGGCSTGGADARNSWSPRADDDDSSRRRWEGGRQADPERWLVSIQESPNSPTSGGARLGAMAEVEGTHGE